jgi:hypothetical protein
MFNGFPRSGNYRHSIRLKNQENEVFYEKQTITLVEIPKFLKGNFTKDNSRLALWLRFFESLNDETVGNAVIDPMFRLLQERAKLSTFTNEFLVSEAMKMGDHNYELYVEKARAREEGLPKDELKAVQKDVLKHGGRWQRDFGMRESAFRLFPNKAAYLKMKF